MDIRAKRITRAYRCLFLAVAISGATAQDVRVSVAPDFLIPLSDTDTFGLGLGASLRMEMDYLGFFAPYIGVDARLVAPATSALDGSLFLASGGGGFGAFAFPLPRLKLGASGGAGIYIGSYSGENQSGMTGNVFWRVGADAGYRVSPSLTVSAGLSYIDFLRERDSFMKGLSVAIMADLALASNRAEGRVLLSSSESVPVYPILAKDYAEKSFGSLTIRNAESAEIRDIELWFHAEGYTAGPVLCGRIPYLPKGASAKTGLLAGFSDQIMAITENVRVRGEIRILYTLLGAPRSVSADATLAILHRNAFVWEDPRILAAFISPNDPSVLDSSKYLAGIVRSRLRHELDANLQYGLGIFEGLRLTGISWSPDPQTPYASMRGKPDETDYVQYPYQTFAYRGGDSDDIAVLFAAELESVGIAAALLPLDGEALVAFRLSRDEAATRGNFSDAGDFLFIDGQAWVPVRVSMLREGFLRAWSEGARLVEADTKARDRFFSLSEAWKRYPPAGVPGISGGTRKPSEEQLLSAFDNALTLVVAKEIGPRAERMRAAFGQGGGTGRQRNSLGVLYAKYGMYAEALEEFKAADALAYGGAKVNLGNIAFLLGSYQEAAAWFEKARAEKPDDPGALIGLARSLYELDRYEEADALFRKSTALMPELAERYGYLSARLSGSAVRASASADRGGGMVWDE